MSLVPSTLPCSSSLSYDANMISLLESGPRCLSSASGRDDSPSPSSHSPIQRSPRSRLNSRMITKLTECRHFHFATVELGPIGLRVEEEKDETFVLVVESDDDSWTIERSWWEIVEFDQQLHRCVFERRHSKLAELGLSEGEEEESSSKHSARRRLLDSYLDRLSRLTGSLITCYPVLKFLEVDSRGGHFSPPEMSAINTPAIAAAIVTKDFEATAPDQLSIRVGDIISIIEMASRTQSETTWWKAKLTICSRTTPVEDPNQNTYRIGFFPSNCVQLFEDKGLHSSPPSNHRPFNPARRVSDLFKRGVRRKNPVFGVDLETHLGKTERQVPLILERCVAAIEKHGIVTGIYRQCGIQSNIQRLRAKFDSGADPNLFEFAIVRDVYCVSSLLKQYFRQLPNPLFTYQLYNQLLTAFEAPSESEKISRLREAVEQLPPGHYNTAKCLMQHLSRLCEHTSFTDMTSRNLAIVWAPNLFRAPPMTNGEDSHLLSGLNVHTALCNFFIDHTSQVFDEKKEDESEHSISGSQCTSQPSPVLRKRLEENNGYREDYRYTWARVFRGKSVDGLAGTRRRTINGAESRRKAGEEERIEEQLPERVKWRRSHSTEAFRGTRSESLLSMISKGYGEFREGVRTWTKRAYSMRPGSRPPPSPQLVMRRNVEPMTESVTASTTSRVSEGFVDRSRHCDIREESSLSSSAGSLKEISSAKERKVAFRRSAYDRYDDLPVAERSSPVEEWSSESRNSPLLEMSRYDNVSPARPREHVIDRVVAGFDLPPPKESPSPVDLFPGMADSMHSDNRDLFAIP